MPMFCVPHSEPKLLGREQELAVLHQQLLDEENPTNLTALQGTGGIGKTQLAAKYCWQRRECGTNPYYKSIVWLNLAGSHPILSQLASYGSELQLGAGDDKALALALIGCLRARRDALLVLDNLERSEQLEGDLGGLSNTRPRQLGCRVLITSRRPDLPGCATMRLDFLRYPLDLALLEREAGHPLSTNEATEELLRLLGGLPLALVLVGRYLKRYPDVSDLAAKLREHGAGPVLTDVGQITRTYHERVGRSFQAVLAELWNGLPADKPHYRALLQYTASLPEGSFVSPALARFL